MDEFEISYAPSTFALSTCQSRLSRPENLAAVVAGVSEYRKLVPLRFTHLEVESIGRLFDARPLLDDAVTAEMIRQQANEAGYLHLSCHGSFAWGRDPLDSALYLAGDRALTLAEILSRLELGSMRLVTLSACETGIIEVNQSPDEYVGLPAGFMQAGATGIVSSLWSVNALSTALLMIKFYEYHLRGDTEAKKGALPPAAALRKAQLCLRDVTNAELAELFDQYRRSGASSQMTAIAQEQFADYVRRDPDERPFAHPYYWAAFAFYGV